MARPGLTQHRKFRRLARALGGDALALGSLEFMWLGAYESGDPYLGDGTDVEGACRWSGEPGQLTAALLDAGFIEAADGQPGHYQIHDLYDHAPEYVQRRMEREAKRRARGETISDVRRKAASERHARAKAAQTSATDLQTSATDGHLHTSDVQTGANGATPSTQHPAQLEKTSVASRKRRPAEPLPIPIAQYVGAIAAAAGARWNAAAPVAAKLNPRIGALIRTYPTTDAAQTLGAYLAAGYAWSTDPRGPSWLASAAGSEAMAAAVAWHAAGRPPAPQGRTNGNGHAAAPSQRPELSLFREPEFPPDDPAVPPTPEAVEALRSLGLAYPWMPKS